MIDALHKLTTLAALLFIISSIIALQPGLTTMLVAGAGLLLVFVLATVIGPVLQEKPTPEMEPTYDGGRHDSSNRHT